MRVLVVRWGATCPNGCPVRQPVVVSLPACRRTALPCPALQVTPDNVGKFQDALKRHNINEDCPIFDNMFK